MPGRDLHLLNANSPAECVAMGLPILALEKLALFFLCKMYKPSLVLVNNKSPLANENKQEQTF
jgi:hypothetical protein